MTISIVLQTANTATVTRTPGWLQRLFGYEESTVLVRRVRMLGFARDGVSPRYSWVDDNREVDDDVADAIDRALTMRAVRERHEKMVRR